MGREEWRGSRLEGEELSLKGAALTVRITYSFLTYFEYCVGASPKGSQGWQNAAKGRADPCSAFPGQQRTTGSGPVCEDDTSYGRNVKWGSRRRR